MLILLQFALKHSVSQIVCHCIKLQNVPIIVGYSEMKTQSRKSRCRAEWQKFVFYVPTNLNKIWRIQHFTAVFQDLLTIFNLIDYEINLHMGSYRVSQTTCSMYIRRTVWSSHQTKFFITKTLIQNIVIRLYTGNTPERNVSVYISNFSYLRDTLYIILKSRWWNRIHSSRTIS